VSLPQFFDPLDPQSSAAVLPKTTHGREAEYHLLENVALAKKEVDDRESIRRSPAHDHPQKIGRF
jgi:hypothetical protein